MVANLSNRSSHSQSKSFALKSKKTLKPKKQWHRKRNLMTQNDKFFSPGDSFVLTHRIR